MAEFAKKQDVISDLGTIRAGALDGASALQSNDVATVALTGSYTDLSNLPDLKTVATSGSYNDLSNKPTIGNATITIQKNGQTVEAFTLNATLDKSINITVPTNNNELTNGAGYITGITDTMINTALGYTAADVDDIPTIATSTTTLTPTTDTLVFTKADLSQESVEVITAITASTTTILS